MRLPGSQIINIQIESLVFVAVRNEIDPVPGPQGEYVLRRVVGDIDRLFAVEVVDPDIVGLTAAITLPCPEFTENPVIGQFFTVGREGTESAPRQRQLLCKGLLRLKPEEGRP